MHLLASIPLIALLGTGIVVAQTRPAATASAPVSIPLRNAGDSTAQGTSEIRGVVKFPEGTPAGGVTVVAATGFVQTSGLRVSVGRNQQTQTSPTGEFSLTLSAPDFVLLVLDERGYAAVVAEGLKESSSIAMQAWARVEGTIRVGSRPGRGETAMLSHHYPPGSRSLFGQRTEVLHHGMAEADEQGRFVFERVPPGTARIGRRLAVGGERFTSTNSVTVDLPAGQTTQVTIGGVGRPVIGRVVTSAPAEQVNWSRGHTSIRNFPEHTQSDPEAYVKSMRHFPVVPDESGRFRVEDVPPGTYALSADLYAPPGWGDRGPYGPLLARIHHSFTMPEVAGGQSDEPLDLEELMLRTVSSDAAASTRPAVSVATAPAATAPAATPRQDQIFLRIVDPEGRPVEQVRVGLRVRPAGNDGNEYWVFFQVDEWSDSDGIVRLDASKVFPGPRENRGPVALYAVHGPRQVVGLREFSPDDLGKEIRWVLTPACRVRGRLTSPALQTPGQSRSWSMIYLHWGNHRPLAYSSRNARFEFLLPAGEYWLYAYGTGTTRVNRTLEIQPGERDREVEIELPASRLALLENRPAPELRDMKAWLHGPPVTLAELRGKVVLLDFWGWWCGPCLEGMPELIELHQALGDRGLVILAIHDDSLGIDELEKKLADLARTRWGGKPLPFRVGLAGGGPTKIEGSDATVKGAVCADYGTTSWPTTVLIDREGRVVRSTGALREQIERLLPPRPATAAAP